MDILNKSDKIRDFIAKIKDVKHIKIIVILLIAAIVFLIVGSLNKSGASILSIKKDESTAATTMENTLVSYTSTENKLADILSDLQGVGKTKVMITQSENGTIDGIIIVAQGAENTLTEWRIRHAVKTAMNIDYTRISVYQMQ